MNPFTVKTTTKSKRSSRVRRAKSKLNKTKSRFRRNGGESKRLTVYRERGPETLFSRLSVTPDRMFVKLRYLEPPYATGTLSGGAVYVDKYAQNSTYDPYLGAGGGQPSGLARMFAQYQYCRVWASTIHFRVTRNEHNSDSPYEIVLVPISAGGAVTPPTTLATYIEQPYAKYMQGVSVYADQPHVITHRIETAKLAGVVPSSLLHSAWYHNNAANASLTNEWHCIVSQANAVVGNTGLFISVQIEYECEFFLRTANPASLIDVIIDDAHATGRFEEVKKSMEGDIKPMPKTVSIRVDPEMKEADIEMMEPFRPPIHRLPPLPVSAALAPTKKATPTPPSKKAS